MRLCVPRWYFIDKQARKLQTGLAVCLTYNLCSFTSSSQAKSFPYFPSYQPQALSKWFERLSQVLRTHALLKLSRWAIGGALT